MFRELSGSKMGNHPDPMLPVVVESVHVEGGHTIRPHAHRRGQLIYASHEIQLSAGSVRGMTTGLGALWVPPGVAHGINTAVSQDYLSVFIDPAFVPAKLGGVKSVAIHPLLKALVTKAGEFGEHYRPDSPESRLIGVLLDQLSNAEHSLTHLPMPRHARLRQVCEKMISDNDTSMTLNRCAELACLSARSVQRIMRRQTGLGFRQWHQRWIILRAIDALLQDCPLKQVAMQSGYSSPSAFITMFKRATGKTPGQFLSAYH